MAEISIRENTWKSLVTIARKRRQRPADLADEALRDYLQRQADEELLEKSHSAARKTAFYIRDTEEIIRERRKRKKYT